MAEVKYRITAEDRTKGALQSAGDGLAGMGKNIAALAMKIVAIVGSFKALEGVMKNSIKAFQEQEDAEKRLATAIASTGRTAEINQKTMLDYASSMQTVTKFGDEAIINAMALTQSFANLNQDGLQKVMPSILDFGEAIGSIDQAASLIGKTLAGETNLLARYGIQIDDNATKSQKLAQITEQLGQKFGGMAEAMAQTSSGRIQVLKNTIDDLLETLGGTLVTALDPMTRGLQEFLTKNKGLISGIFANLPEVVSIAFTAIGKIIERTFTGSTFLTIIQNMTKLLVVAFKTAVLSFFELIKTVIESIPDMLSIALESGMGMLRGKKLSEAEFKQNKDQFLNPFAQAAIGFAPDYKTYLGEYEKANAAGAQKLDAAFGSMKSKWGTLFTGIGDNFKKYAEEAGVTFSAIGNEFKDIVDDAGKKIKGLESKSPAVAGKAPVPEMGVSFWTQEKAQEIGSNIARGMKRGLEIQQEENAKKYAGMGGQRGSEGMADTGPKLGQLFQSLGDQIWNALTAIENVSKIMNPFQTILASVIETISGPLNTALQPIVNVMMNLGKIIGGILLPVIQILAPIIESIANIFIWLYNNVLIHFGNGVIFILNIMNNGIAFFWNGLADFLNWLLGWTGFHMERMEVRELDQGFLKPIGADSTKASETASSGGGGGGSAQYSQARNVVVNVQINSDVIAGEGGIRDLALIIRDEIFAAEALGF